LPKKYKKSKKKKTDELDELDELEEIKEKFPRIKRERSPEEKREYKRLALFLVGWLVFVASLYVMFVQIEEAYWIRNEMTEGVPVTALVYIILGAVLFFVWLIFNGGFKKIDVTKYEKPDDMGFDEFCRFIDKLKERQRKAKYFLIYLCRLSLLCSSIIR